MLSIALLGVLLGMALPTGVGCFRCPKYQMEDLYWISIGERADWTPGSGRLEVTETAIVFSYTTTDGSLWEVEYMRFETYED